MKRQKYIGIDLGTFTSNHSGGKDEVAYHILRGMAENGHASRILVLCTSDLNDRIRKIHENFKIVNYPNIKRLGRFISKKWLRNVFLKFLCYRYSFLSILFTDKGSPNVKLPFRTIVIPHDIQVYEMGRIPGIVYSETLATRLKKMIQDDFFYRDVIVAISEFDKHTMERYFAKYETRICQIYNPVRFSFFCEKPDTRKKYITAINIQWIHKNIVTLIRAFSSIAQKVPYDLMLVGKKGDSASVIDAAIEKSPYRERILTPGFVTQEKLEQVIRETALYVNPSYFEGFGMVAVEMMGVGVPTLVADNTAQRETTLSLCDYYRVAGDAENLANAVLTCMEHSKTVDEMHEIAYKIREKYDYRRIAEKYYSLLTDVC